MNHGIVDQSNPTRLFVSALGWWYYRPLPFTLYAGDNRGARNFGSQLKGQSESQSKEIRGMKQVHVSGT